MQKPVDIAPHPLYRSNKNFSSLWRVSKQFEAESLERVDDAAVSVGIVWHNKDH